MSLDWKNEDGLLRDRLFFESFCLKKVIKENILLVEMNNKRKVLKGFASKNKILRQIQLSMYLMGKNNPGIIPFEKHDNGKWLIYYNHMFWGSMPLIEGKPLSYHQTQDRFDGLTHLQKFHFDTKGIPFEVASSVHSFCLIDKWVTRYIQFKRNVEFVSFTNMDKTILNQIVDWGEWVFANLPKPYLMQLENIAIHSRQLIHGDVALHNFVKTKNNQVFLLDFDFIAFAPREYDFLQYVNRNLPFLDWSLNKLDKLLQKANLESCFHQKWFLIALAFPLDIYREWNRSFQHGYIQRKHEKKLINYTLWKFKKRKQFVQEIMSWN